MLMIRSSGMFLGLIQSIWNIQVEKMLVDNL